MTFVFYQIKKNLVKRETYIICFVCFDDLGPSHQIQYMIQYSYGTHVIGSDCYLCHFRLFIYLIYKLVPLTYAIILFRQFF